MRANGFSPNTKKDFFLENFGGNDFYSSPIDANKKRAISGKNFIVENGILRKRNGWEEIYSFFDSQGYGVIRNIQSFTLINSDGKKSKFLFVAYDDSVMGARTLLCGEYKDDVLEAFISPISTQRNPHDEENVSVFLWNNKIIVFCGSINSFGYDEILMRWRWYEEGVEEFSAYIPTTVINIGAVDETDDVRSSYEEVNLISPYVKNSFSLKLRGNDSNRYYSEFRLANKTNPNKVGFELDLLTGYDEDGNEIWEKMYGVNGEKDDQGRDVIEFKLQEKTEYDENTIGIIRANNAATLHIDKNGNATLELYTKKELATIIDGLYFSSASLNNGRNEIDNLVLTFPLAVDFNKSYQKITNCRFGTKFGADGVDDRLFLSGNPQYPNIVFYSGVDNPLYFPDVNTIACGNESSAINGFSRLGDGTLAIHKEDGQDSTIYYCTPTTMVGQDLIGDIQKTTEVFLTRAGAIGEGVVNAFTQANFAGDNIMVSKNGVFGLSLGTNIATNERFARERSRLINPKLTQYDLSEAVAIVHKGKYYLAVGGDCFVADARYVFTENHDMNDTYNYEWWFWENVPAYVWAVIDDELYFGTKDGRICKFMENFEDVKYYISNNEMSVDYVENRIVFNSGIKDKVQNSDGWVVNANLYVLFAESTDFFILNNKIIFGNNMPHRHIIEGGNLYLQDEYTARKVTIRDVNFIDMSFSLYDDNGNQITTFPQKFKLLSNLSGDTVIIKNVLTDENGIPSFQIEDDFGLLKLEMINGSGVDMFINEKLIFRRNVCAEWYTPMLDLGAPQYLKCAKAVTIVCEPFYESEAIFGYITRLDSRVYDFESGGKEYQARNYAGLDFRRVNFNEWTFTLNNFAERFTKRIHEKNVNYVMFKVVSDNNQCATINNMSITYTINSRTKGVM
ncbi:MAG: hypothetical protein IJ981_03135 [Clostridia bacterium]|nr:hypothetical protein [Clostridia bacterium]